MTTAAAPPPPSPPTTTPEAALDSTQSCAAGGASPKSPSLGVVLSQLCKARLSSLVVLTSGAGFLMAGPVASVPALVAATTGTALAAASAATFNQLFEVSTDALMKRTAGRPLPAGHISRGKAAAFGFGTLFSSAALLTFGANPLTAVLGVGNVALYALIYTPMKLRSTWNTAVGALVGAIPPVMGWVAATGDIAAVEPLLLGGLLFWWQFPHFYSLAWNLRRDYGRGGYAMVPVLDTTGGKTTAWLSLRSSAAMAALPLVATAVGATGPMFAVEGTVLGAYFMMLATRFYRTPNDATARALFRASLWYLPVLLFFMVFHSRRWLDSEEVRAAVSDGEPTTPASTSAPSDFTPASVVDAGTATVSAAGVAAAAASTSGEPAAAAPDAPWQPPVAAALAHLFERGVAQLHELGHTACVHHLLVRDKLAAARTRMTGAVESAFRRTPSPSASAGAPGDATNTAAAAAAADRGDGAARCPIVVVEAAVSRASAAAGITTAAAATSPATAAAAAEPARA